VTGKDEKRMIEVMVVEREEWEQNVVGEQE